MHDALIVQVSNPCADLSEERESSIGRHPVREAIEGFSQGLPFDELHHDPALLVFIKTDVVDGDQIGVTQI